ncbi:MAG: hypothetical protein HQ483_07435 [Rhodospirillales bacterium]|nr:hypothetical protein [Rhodospirillales bacterium]
MTYIIPEAEVRKAMKSRLSRCHHPVQNVMSVEQVQALLKNTHNDNPRVYGYITLSLSKLPDGEYQFLDGSTVDIRREQNTGDQWNQDSYWFNIKNIISDGGTYFKDVRYYPNEHIWRNDYSKEDIAAFDLFLDFNQSMVPTLIGKAA